MAQELTAYFDESATESVGIRTLPRESKVVVIAGFLATAEQWERLEENWNYIFLQHGLPRDAVFHMNEFTQSMGAFAVFQGKTWERGRFLSQLIGLLDIRVRCSIARALRLKDYDDLDATVNLRGKASAYTICGLAAIERAVRWREYYGNVELKIVFEDGFPDVGQLSELCKRERFPIPSFEAKPKFMALQAADMVAWESQKLWKKALGQEDRPVRKSMKAIAEIRSDWADYSSETLLEFARYLRCEPRSTFPEPCP